MKSLRSHSQREVMTVSNQDCDVLIGIKLSNEIIYCKTVWNKSIFHFEVPLRHCRFSNDISYTLHKF
jgi:hypothetical protein